MKRFLAGFFFAAAAILLGNTVHASAATLDLVPAVGTYIVGQTVTARITVSSAEAVNAVSGTLSFPTEHMSVTSVSRTGSLVNVWVQDPSYSNTAGTVNFEGIILNPGFTGIGGTVMNVTFKMKTAGPASVRFSGGSILANDGKGTNLLSGFGNGSYTISEGLPAPTQPTTSAPPQSPKPAESVADTTPPRIRAFAQVVTDDPRDPTPTFSWKVDDSGSGLAHLSLKVGDNTPMDLSLAETSVKLLPQPPGTYPVVLQATDAAGNTATQTVELAIQPLDAPLITDAWYLPGRSAIGEGSPIPTTIVSGTAFPGAYIELTLRHGGETWNTAARANDQGTWAATHHGTLSGGTWEITARATDERGARSEWTAPYAFSIPSRWNTLLSFLTLFATALGIVVGIALVAGAAYWLTHHGLLWHRRLQRERTRADVSSSRSPKRK
jgi:hypothetical protein